MVQPAWSLQDESRELLALRKTLASADQTAADFWERERSYLYWGSHLV